MASWAEVYVQLQALSDLRQKNAPLMEKMNKVHQKLALKDTPGVTLTVAEKLIELYTTGLDKTEKELLLIQETLTKLAYVITEEEAKRKKRKSDDRKEGLQVKTKKPKVASSGLGSAEESLEFARGDHVVVKPENQDWILAVVIRAIPEKGKFEVEDIEDDEHHPGVRKRYIFPPRVILPIPKPPTKEFPAGSFVLALYPFSSCFYKALVLEPPSGNRDPAFPNSYLVRFDDDDGMSRYVDAGMVVEYPKHFEKKKQSLS